jgi:hypothetical protein
LYRCMLLSDSNHPMPYRRVSWRRMSRVRPANLFMNGYGMKNGVSQVRVSSGSTDGTLHATSEWALIPRRRFIKRPFPRKNVGSHRATSQGFLRSTTWARTGL